MSHGYTACLLKLLLDNFLKFLHLYIALLGHRRYNFFLVFICVGVSCLHVCLCVWCPWRIEKDIGSSGAEVTDGFEQPCVYENKTQVP